MPSCKRIHLSFAWNQHPLSTDKKFDDAHWRIFLSNDKMLKTSTGEFADDDSPLADDVDDFKKQLIVALVDAVEKLLTEVIKKFSLLLLLSTAH